MRREQEIILDDELGKVFSISCSERISGGRCRHGFLEHCLYSSADFDIPSLSRSSRSLHIRVLYSEKLSFVELNIGLLHINPQ
ncbi:uncharacterized protein ARMOST_06137 [Armillaria ostoyae]|uniref:Uncharacterized protein n=1 Tax=Armillaria ostoyae TaxID=47428 RepID=A0A284R261_ARMOS|nr:uncharacterized protein ARMOST_06137 [Armillaria ostoyae]